MNIYVYSDESGVLDKIHNDYYVFAGVILLDKAAKDKWTRLYSAAEASIRTSNHLPYDYELKATHLNNKDKSHLFRSLNKCYKFGVIINQNNLLDTIFMDKKTKQRYLDYTYKIAVKRALEQMILNGLINPNNVENMCFFVDEHTTATNGKYELGEGLKQEFKYGTHNYKYDRFFPPLFKSMHSLTLTYCNSQKVTLVRAADIIANKLYYLAVSNNEDKIQNINNLYISFLP